MKRALLTFVPSILFFITLSCSKDDDSSDSYNKSSITATWELIRIEDQDSGIISTPPEDSVNPISITFEADTFQGSTEANSFFGDYSVSSNELVIERIGSTLVAESTWGAMFFEAITSDTIKYSIEDNTLMIEYEDSKFMHFSKRGSLLY